MVSDTVSQLWMDRLLRLAGDAGERGEIPVAAVLLDERGRCLGWGSNRRHRRADPLGHAELLALRRAAAARRDWRFNGCTLVVTLEPCPMCAGALIQARVGTVIYGAGDPKRGALGGSLDLSLHPSAHHHMRVQGGILGEQASEQLEQWFRIRRLGQGAAQPREAGSASPDGAEAGSPPGTGARGGAPT